MTKHFLAPKARGIVAVRADMSDPAKILAEMAKTFEEFKDEQTKEIAALKKGQADVVQSEKVDRINAQITDLTKALDDVNAAMAAIQAGGATGAETDKAKAEHATAFNAWFRKGDRALTADMHELEVNAALTTQSDPDGGYFVPEEMASGIDRVVGTVSAMRQLAQVMTISTDTYKKLIGMGGASAGWVGETEARPETGTPTLRELIFNVMELYANPAATQSLLDDSRLDIAAWLAGEVATTFAEQEGAAFVTGDGVKKPRGFTTYDTVANSAYTWGKLGFIKTGQATALSADGIVDLMFGLKQQYRMGAAFIMSDDTMAKIRKLKDGDGNFIWALPSGTQEVPTILGKPVYTDDNMPSVAANSFPIGYGNWNRGYLIVDRFGIRVLRDPFTNKPYIHFYTTKRVGGGVQNFEAIKLQKVAS